MTENQVRLLKKAGRVHYVFRKNLGEVSITLKASGKSFERIEVDFAGFNFNDEVLEEINFSKDEAVKYLAINALQDVADSTLKMVIHPENGTFH